MRGHKISLEIFATGQNIAFCFTASDEVAEVFSGQVYGLAPDCDILEITDFVNQINDKVQFLTSELTLTRNDLFPLKTYTEFEGDSLSGLLSVLTKCVPGEMVFVQVVVKSVSDSSLLHFRLNSRKRIERFRQLFRVKYWFKKGIKDTFKEKIDNKTSGRLFKTNVRVGAISTNAKVNPLTQIQALIGAMSNFNTLDLNQFRPGKIKRHSTLMKVKRRFLGNGFLLSTKELATLFHLPSERSAKFGACTF